MLDNDDVPLGEFLDEQIARAREKENIETDYIDESDDEDSPPNKYELPVVPEGYVLDGGQLFDPAAGRALQRLDQSGLDVGQDDAVCSLVLAV